MEIKRRFIIGEEWLYIKLYSGPKMLEEILIGDIYSTIEYLYSLKIISKFFFVRYFDEGHHLRLRFRLAAPDKLSQILSLLSEKLKDYSDNRILSKVIIDTYDREIERYGKSTIEHIETIFSINSWEILNVLKSEEDYNKRWLTGIKIMDNLLNKFELGVNEKYSLYQTYYLYYLEEFGDNKLTKEELKKQYRTHGKEIEKVIKESYHNPGILEFSLQRENDIDDTVNYILELRKNKLLEVSFDKLLKDIMHMHYNRLFRNKPRSHEFVIYYMMCNFYKSLSLRNS